MLLKSSSASALEIASKPFTAAIDPKKNAKEFSTILRADRKIEAPATDGQLVVTGEGEYEKQDMFIFAIPAYKADDKLAFVLEQEGRKVLYLPDIGSDLSDQVIAEAGGIDVLALTLPPKAEAKDLKTVVEKLDPRLLLVRNASSDILNKAGLATEAESVTEFDTEKASYSEDKTSVVMLG